MQPVAAIAVSTPSVTGTTGPVGISGARFTDILRSADAAQSGMDKAIRSAMAGPDLKPGELLALQASLYRSSLELDLAGKVVEKISSGLKQTLSTTS
jgi:hypothetical protein